ncbi:hypothetical protein O6H91_10G010700 [Diphasiastrum complanatum]|uniref:Uncharacterized protein n=1 Tax=Diphasiastrum complanatum TaxID=34168 RepID=A0ACC2CEH9_DIPCM|nr:hypothetical protein O6H91_10G010700 [Diphasiastrum complanatum]
MDAVEFEIINSCKVQDLQYDAILETNMDVHAIDHVLVNNAGEYFQTLQCATSTNEEIGCSLVKRGDIDSFESLSMDCSIVDSSSVVDIGSGKGPLKCPSNSNIQCDYALHYLDEKIRIVLNTSFGKARIGSLYKFKPTHGNILHRPINEFGTFLE